IHWRKPGSPTELWWG
ncbi:phage terminase-like protein large subunit, partial [Escherichia coli 5412]